MAEEAKKAPVEESKETKTVETKTETPKEESKTEVKVGDALKTVVKETKEPKMVPEAVLIEYKKENKEVLKELRDLKKSIEEGATKKEVSTDIKTIAEKHNVDADFLNEFAAAVRKEAKEDAKAELKPIEDKAQAEKLDKVFNENFDKTLEENPEYKKLVNKDVIRTLAFDPNNANKTFSQIFESAYGHLVTGKKTLEATKPRGGKEDVRIDFAKAAKDQEYLSEILSDPELKKKYNENLESRLRF